MSQVSSTKKLLSASAFMAAGTMISRVLGVVRVMMIAYILGNGTRQADMLGIATMVPNALYILLAGGALNTVLVPQIVRAIKNDDDGGEAYTNRIMTAFMLVVTAVAVLVTAAAPLVTSLYTSAKWRVPELAEQYSSMVALTYLTLPQIFFYGAFFLLGQVLNARDKFGPMMWAPITNNVISILVLVFYFFIWGNDSDHSAAFSTGQILLLGIGSTLGIAAQTLVLLPYVKKVGFKLRPRFDLRGTGLGKTFSLTKWTMGFVAVNQIALMVVNQLATSATASGHGAGSTVYSNAHLMWILPHSLITVSLATAMLPNASRLAASADMTGVGNEFTKTVRLALIAIVPAAVGFLTLGEPLAGALFGHGTGAADAKWIAWALMAFAIGLIPFTVQFVCLRTFYALENTRSPFLLQLIIAGFNIGSAITLVWLVNSEGVIAAALALSYSLSYLFGVLFSWQSLKRTVPALNGGRLLLHIVRLLLGACIGGVGAYFLANWLMRVIPNAFLGNVVALAAGAVVILLPYLGIGKLLKVRELNSLSDLVRSKFGKRRPVTEEEVHESSLGVAGFSTREQLLLDDQLPTIIQPAIIDEVPRRGHIEFEDSGPATIVRNRPAVTQHDFQRTESAEEDSEPITEVAAEETEETTGQLDLSSVFRTPETKIATVGALLNTRFELIELLAARYGTETWRAHDQVLSRDVVVHVIAAGDTRIPELLKAARKGAAATDSRFLRVLDAAENTDPTLTIGAYVVAEFAGGKSVAELLTKGPLSAIEAAHISREIADALVAVHAQGLFHEQLNPENVIITNAGAVRIVGFGVEASLAGPQGTDQAWAAREQQDVQAIGKLLYAMLVRFWPGAVGWGLAAAPVSASGEPLAPQQVQAGISPALDRICVSTLATAGPQRAISSAAALVSALTQVLGTADASADLEQRVRSWDTDTDLPVIFDASLPEPTEATTRVPSSLGSPHGVVEPTHRPRRGLWLLIIAIVLTFLISLIVLAINNAQDNAEPSSPTSSSPAASPDGSSSPETGLTIVAAKDFDPETDGGNGEEYPELVGNVYDGDPATAWRTMRYLNRPNLGGLKPGVGVFVDLGEVKTVSEAELILGSGETSVELRVPKGAEPSLRSEADWRQVGTNAAAKATTTIKLESPTETRYLLVYFTKLPPLEGGYIGELKEVRLS